MKRTQGYSRLAAEPRREVSGAGSSAKQVNDFHLIPFHVMTHKNVLVTHCCCCLTAIKINAQREFEKMAREERG